MTEKTTRSIELHFSKQMVSLGEELKFMVTYHNHSDKTIEFKDPGKTWEVVLEFKNLNNNGMQRIPFGRILTDTSPDGLTSQSAEPADIIVLKPKQKYCFIPETFTRHADLFEPGKYQMRVIDRSNDLETLESNTIEIVVEVNRLSFENLVALYSDTEHTDHTKEFAWHWIKELNPEFKDSSLNISDSSILSKFLLKWQDAKNSPEITERIKLIHMQKGVEKH